MNHPLRFIIAGAALALAGCTAADGPIFANDATQATGANAGPSVAEQSRDINNWMTSGQNMGQMNSAGAAPAQSLGIHDPYGH